MSQPNRPPNPWWADLALVVFMFVCFLIIGMAIGSFGGTPNVRGD